MTTAATSNTPWPIVKLGDVCEILDSKRKPITKKDRVPGTIPYYGATGIVDYVEGYIFDEKLVLLGEDGAKWGVADASAFIIEGKTWVNNHAHVLRPKDSLLHDYLTYYLNTSDLTPFVTGVTVPKLNQQKMSDIPIPLPPLEVQREIVAKVEKGLAEADALAAHFKRLAVLADETFKAELDETFQFLSAPTVKLGDVCEIVLGGTPSTKVDEYWGGEINWLTPSDMGKINGMYVDTTSRKITHEGLIKGSRLFPENSVIVSTRAPIGYVLINTVPMCTNQGCKTLVPDSCLLAEYLYFNLQGRTEELNALGTGTTFKELATGNLKSIEIPLPTLAEQQVIVAKLEAVKAKCERLKAEAERGVKAAEALRKAVLAEAFEQ